MGIAAIVRMAATALCAAVISPGAGAVIVPGNPDATFGNFGLATGGPTTSSDIVYNAVGVGGTWVTGAAVRGTSSHLFLAKFQADGTLDPAFGTAGRTMLRLDWPSDGRMVRVQPDGKIVVAGTHMVWPSSYEMILARFNFDGTLDTAFATNGVFRQRVFGFSYGWAVDIQADGKLLLGGTAFYGVNSAPDMAVIRLNANGTLDNTFGTAGLVTIDFRGGFDAIRNVFETVGHKILVSGSSANAPAGTLDFSITRLNPDGSVDTTFGPPGQNGLVLVDAGGLGGYDDGEAMSIGSGVIWLGGTTQNADSSYSMAIVKLTSAGLLDTTFNGTGRVKTPAGGQHFGQSLAPTASTILVGGAAGGHFALARFNLDGTPDASYGTGGFVQDAEGAGEGIVSTIASADGSVLAVGSIPEAADSFKRDIARVRYTPAGARDGTYGTGGKTMTNLFTLSWDVRAVSLEPDNRVVVLGTLFDTFDGDFGTLRLKADGSRDTSWAFSGIGSVNFVNGFDRGYAMVRQADGKRVLAGSNNQNGTGYFALARVDASGNLDINFGNNGRTTHTMGIGFAEAFALAQTPDNKLVAAGYAVTSGTNADFAIARYSANGVLDATFGTGGVVLTSFGPEYDVAQSVAVQPDGKIVAAGYKRTGGLHDFAIARYTTTGALDATFGTGGLVTIPVGASNDLAHAVAILRDGKILVAGESFTSGTGNDMAVMRLNANGSIDGTFGTAGGVIVNFTSGTDAANAMVVQANGKIVLGGTATADGAAGTQRGFGWARMLASGARDVPFGFGYLAGGLATNDITASVDTVYAMALQRDGKIVSVGTAGTQWAVTRYFGDPRSTAVATDLNGDTRSDILYRNASTGQVYRVLMNGFTVTDANVAYDEPNLAWHIVADGDFTGEGTADVLYRNDSTGQVFVMPFNANGFPVAGGVVHVEPNPAWHIVGTPDLDGDGKADILWWNSNSGQVYAILLNGTAVVSEGFVYTEPDTNWRIVAVGDFAGSGKRNQLLWRHNVSGAVYLMTVNASAGTFGQTGQMVYTEPNTAWKIVGAADFDGDGRSDILWRNDVTGQVYIMLMDGPVIASQGLMYTESNLAWKIVANGDYNGDGKADILYRNDATGQLYMMLMNGLAIGTEQMVYTEPNLQWKVLGPLEYGN